MIVKKKVAFGFLCILFHSSCKVIASVTPLLKANSERGNVQKITWNCVRRLEAVTRWRSVQSIGYPRLLNVKKSRCTWKMVTDAGSRIRLAFRGLDLHADDPKHCSSNYIEIIDETLKQSQARLCGKKIPNDIVSEGNKIRIDFQAQPGIATNSKGFSIAYAKTNDAPGFYSFRSFLPQQSSNQQQENSAPPSSRTPSVKSTTEDLKNSAKKQENNGSVWGTTIGGIIASLACIGIGLLVWKRRKSFAIKKSLNKKKKINTNVSSTLAGNSKYLKETKEDPLSINKKLFQAIKQKSLPLDKKKQPILFGDKISQRPAFGFENQNRITNNTISYRPMANLSSDIHYLDNENQGFCSFVDSNARLKSIKSETLLHSGKNSNAFDQHHRHSKNTWSNLSCSDDSLPPPLPPKTKVKSLLTGDDFHHSSRHLSSFHDFKEVGSPNKNFKNNSLHDWRTDGLSRSKSIPTRFKYHNNSNISPHKSHSHKNQDGRPFAFDCLEKTTEDHPISFQKTGHCRSFSEFPNDRPTSRHCFEDDWRRKEKPHKVIKTLPQRSPSRQTEVFSLCPPSRDRNSTINCSLQKLNSFNFEDKNTRCSDYPPPLPVKQKKFNKLNYY